MFKAWNKDAKLLMRLNSIECNRGELVKKDHILLQFTGLLDIQKEEIYDMDILIIAQEKHIVTWDNERNGWMLAKLSDTKARQPLLSSLSTKATRLWNYFETDAAR